MKRYHDWEKRLLEFLLSRRYTPFKWGKHDCSLFACDAILAMTGVDIAADFRGRYSTEFGAAKVIRQFAGGNLENLALQRGAEARMYQYWESELKTAKRGDIVLVAVPEVKLLALGIVGLDGKAYCAGEVGYVKYPLKYWARAWRVG